MSKDFQDFQRHFKEYQQKFGLNGYKVYFKFENLDDINADLTADVSNMVATVRLNNDRNGEDKKDRSGREIAKHEALHLLVNRLEANAKYRYSSKEEIDESAEELVRKLEGLIP